MIIRFYYSFACQSCSFSSATAALTIEIKALKDGQVSLRREMRKLSKAIVQVM